MQALDTPEASLCAGLGWFYNYTRPHSGFGGALGHPECRHPGACSAKPADIRVELIGVVKGALSYLPVCSDCDRRGRRARCCPVSKCTGSWLRHETDQSDSESSHSAFAHAVAGLD
jgi:hypothetical protein